MIISCSNQNEENIYIDKSATHEEIKSFIIQTFRNAHFSDQVASSRSNSCQLGDAEPFPCDTGSGGSCKLYRNVGGHDACVYCIGGDNDGDHACSGSFKTYDLPLSQISSKYGRYISINYKITTSNNYFSGSGILTNELTRINSISNKGTISFKLNY